MSAPRRIASRVRQAIGRQPESRNGGERRTLPPDCDRFTADLIASISPYTLTPPDRIIGLVDAVRHVVAARIPGAFAECGVWRGGSVMAIAATLLDRGITDRDIYLFDTFDQSWEAGDHDVTVRGRSVAELLEQAVGTEELLHLPMADLRAALAATGYPEERFRFVEGPVEDTLPEAAPDSLALCRLDTDLYESTAHEIEHLWPRLSAGGILIIDDYGHFMGAKKAVDEYFERTGTAVLLQRLDSSARLVIKPQASP